MNQTVYKTLIADDEAPARQRLIRILEKISEVEIVGEATDGPETVEKINSLRPDLIFLDIQMPGLTGFDVLHQADHVPVIIFCTAYDDYALKAFETNAIDYIVKPVKDERVRKAIGKLETLTRLPDKQQILDILRNYLNHPVKKPVVSIPVKLGDRMLLVRLADISYFESDDKYVAICTREGKKYLTNFSLKYLEEKLEDQFIRIHRSLLVNRNQIREINRYFGNRYVVKMEDLNQSKLISGRNYSDKLSSMFEL